MQEDDASSDEHRADGAEHRGDGDNTGLSSDSRTIAEQKPMSATEWAMLYAG
ncbi:MAG: hypothetical protein AAF899_07700 [Pseudomonadota bacterium]